MGFDPVRKVAAKIDSFQLPTSGVSPSGPDPAILEWVAPDWWLDLVSFLPDFISSLGPYKLSIVRKKRDGNGVESANKRRDAVRWTEPSSWLRSLDPFNRPSSGFSRAAGPPIKKGTDDPMSRIEFSFTHLLNLATKFEFGSLACFFFQRYFQWWKNPFNLMEINTRKCVRGSMGKPLGFFIRCIISSVRVQ